MSPLPPKFAQTRVTLGLLLPLGLFMSCQSPDAESALRREADTPAQDRAEWSPADAVAGDSDIPVAGEEEPLPDALPAQVLLDPASVDGVDTRADVLNWTAAATLPGITYVPNRDSVKLLIPAVPNAVDYRVIALTAGMSVTNSANRETVRGTTITCAGYRQRNVYVNKRELVTRVEVTGVAGATQYVVEAIDRSCPFTGVHGVSKASVTRSNSSLPASEQGTFSLYTEAEIVARYGSMIINGQGVAAKRGTQAAVNPPIVLARSTIAVTPLGTASAPPVATFFDDFNLNDQPRLIEKGTYNTNHEGSDIYQNNKWTFHGAFPDVMQYFTERGQLHGIIADGGGENFASMIAYPRRAAAVSASDYLHVTFEVNTHTTARRYWWLSLCGADTLGQTLKSDGQPAFFLRPNSSLQIGDGNNPNTAGMNCVMVFPKNGNRYFPLPPNNTAPETDVRVLVYGAGTGTTGRNVDPDIYHYDWMGPLNHTWYRQLNAQKQPIGPMLDLQNLNAPRVKFDLFVKKGRVVLYADGQQKLCNDFNTNLMTLAESAVGFGQVLYHTAAEHNDVAPDAAGSPLMRHVYQNMPFFDRRDWDNLGYQEHSSLPKSGFSFDASLCYADTKN